MLGFELEVEEGKLTLKELSPTASEPITVSLANGLLVPIPTF